MKSKSVVLVEVEQLLRASYNGRTPDDYLFHIKNFLAFSKNVPQRVNNEDFFEYNLYLSKQELSFSYRNVAINAILAYFRLYLRKKVKGYAIIRPPKQTTIPKDIPHDFLVKKINAVKSSKSKLILLLGYGCGMRSSEVVNLKMQHINIENQSMVIQGKGNKERQLSFSNDIAYMMLAYVEEYNPKVYLFNGQSKPKYTSSSILKLVKKHVGAYTFHQLRHSYASKMLRNGVDIGMLSKLMGHSRTETTMIYNHLLTTEIDKELLPV